MVQVGELWVWGSLVRRHRHDFAVFNNEIETQVYRTPRFGARNIVWLKVAGITPKYVNPIDWVCFRQLGLVV